MAKSVVSVIVATISVLFFSVALAQSDASLSGSWVLVEQTYEEGGYNFADLSPMTLTFDTSSGALSGVVRWKSTAGQFESIWPTYPTESGSATLDRVEFNLALDQRSATASYDVRPAAGDDTTLHVVETYELEKPDTVRSTVRVNFVRNGDQRGGFTWTRTFERGDR